MAESTGDNQVKTKHPSAETIKHYRHLVKERIPQAEKVQKKSGIKEPGEEKDQKEYKRLIINTAGELLRQEIKAQIDPLTELLNLDGYRRREALEIERARFGHHLTVAVIDLNNLKTINDSQGHQKGDEYLIAAANALRESARQNDIVARTGGDEFRVLFPETDLEQAKVWLERTKIILEEKGVSASIGLSPVDLSIGVKEAVRIADQNMYAEKRRQKAEYARRNGIRGKLISLLRRLAGKGNGRLHTST